MDLSNLSTLGNLGVGGIFCVLVLKLVFDFLAAREKRRAANGEDPDGACMAAALLQTLNTQTKALQQLMEHAEDVKRVMHRTEKVLDRLDTN